MNSCTFWGIMKTHPVANITITQWQNHFVSLLNMTGNRPENEAVNDGQENRTEDYCETEIRDMARQKHSGETVINCYKNVTVRERNREGGGPLMRMKSQRDKEIETETTQKTKKKRQKLKKLYLSSAISVVSLGTSRFVWDTNVCWGTPCFCLGHKHFL